MTAALIVRDEELTLPDCLRSIDGLVDEVLVVDTGSTDATVAVAHEHGARVHRAPWEDDFSAARNAGLELARGRWILWIDADERVAPVSRDALELLFADDDVAAYMVLLRPAPGFTPYRECRIFRNDPAIRFEGAIHERILPAAAAVGPVGRAPMLIEHEGYSPENDVKPRRDVPMLLRRLREHPDDVDRWRRLAVASEALGDAEVTRESYAAAIELIRSGNQAVGSAAALTYSGFARWLLERGEDADEILEEGLASFPKHHVLTLLCGRLAIARGNDHAAIACFSRLLAVDRELLPESGISYDERLFGAIPHAAIGGCLFRQERYAESAAAYARAAAADPDDLEIRAKGSLAAVRAEEAVRAA